MKNRLKPNLIPEKWQAQWIDPETERPFLEVIPVPGQEKNPNPGARVKKVEHRKGGSLLKKTFSLSSVPESVLLYATAHGIYDIWINGVHVDGFLLAPGTSQYNRRLMVQCYEAADLLLIGENEIIVSLGDGWYRGCVGNSQDINTFGDDLAFLCQMNAHEKTLMATDETWLAAQGGPLGLNDLMRGEYFDARISCGDLDWHPVKIMEVSFENLIPTDCPPVAEKEHFAARCLTTPAGETVLDFGQNFAGYVSFCIPDAPEGGRLCLTHGETLDEQGNFTTANFQNPAKPECHQRIEYICRAGLNRYKPTKCYFGFRYVKVESSLPVSPEMFTGIAIYSDIAEKSAFTCGDERVNQLFRNAMWSMKSNFVGVPTDCPTREKSGFSGDAQVFCETAMTLMDAVPVLRSWLRDLGASALPGIFRQVAPDARRPGYFENSPGWCDAIELIPWRIWKRTGEEDVIRENYGAMKNWLDFCIERARETRPENQDRLPEELKPYFADMGFCWGEWLEPGADSRQETAEHMRHGEPEVSTAYLSYGCAAMSEMAEAIGKHEDFIYYREIAEKAKAAYRHAFLPIESSRQCRYVRPVFMGLLKEEEKYEAVAKLAEIVRSGGRLNTGFLTTAELCRVLTDYGQTGTAYELLLQTGCPSWLYQVAKGATTIWEHWDGVDESGKARGSLNHYAYGSIAGWLVDSVCGIRVEKGTVRIAPKPDKRLGFAEAKVNTPEGEIRSAWRYEGETCVFTVCVPEKVKAEITFPDGKVTEAAGGETTWRM